MEMGSRRSSGRADLGDLLPALNKGAFLHDESTRVGVERLVLPRVFHHDHFAVAAHSPRDHHAPRLRGEDRSSGPGRDVDALVFLTPARSKFTAELSADGPSEVERGLVTREAAGLAPRFGWISRSADPRSTALPLVTARCESSSRAWNVETLSDTQRLDVANAISFGDLFRGHAVANTNAVEIFAVGDMMNHATTA